MIGLAGCSSNNEQANSASQATVPTETTEPEVNPTTTPSETALPATTSPTETNKDTANTNPQNSDKQLQELLELAKNDKIYTYQANDQYQLKFIIPSSTGKVGHISVFSEQDSTNNMAG